MSEHIVPFAHDHAESTVLYRVVFEPQQVWKGRRSDDVTLEVGIRECDMGFEVGRDYVVVAQPSGSHLTSNRCSSARREEAAEIMKALDLWAANSPLQPTATAPR